MRLAAIVLAAGRSNRMGSNKLLLEVGGWRVIDHILFSLRLLETVVVLGHNPEELKRIAETQGVKTVYNPDYDGGMTTSFRAGLRALDPKVEAVFMVLSDTFGFSQRLLKRMSDVMEEASEALIVSPVYEGRRGHPVLFRRPLFDELFGLGDGETLRDVVDCHEESHMFVEADVWCILDLDTPEDYERVKRLWAEIRT